MSVVNFSIYQWILWYTSLKKSVNFKADFTYSLKLDVLLLYLMKYVLISVGQEIILTVVC